MHNNTFVIELFNHKTLYQQNEFTNYIFNINVKQYLALNNLQWLIGHKTKSNQSSSGDQGSVESMLHSYYFQVHFDQKW